MISEVWDGVNLNLTFRTVVSAQITRDRPRFRLSAVTARTVRVRACAETVRGENGRKRSVNTKTIFIFIFFLGNEIENGNSGNENDIGNSETSETKVRYKN
jgi:hypothetical protein